MARTHELLEDTAKRLLGELPRMPATARGAVIREAASACGVKLNTMYSRLKALGWKSGRKERKDKGSSKISTGELAEVARIMARGRNKRGQVNVPTTEAVRITQEQGQLREDISAAQVTRLLREHGLDARRMRAPRAAISRVSAYPNHVWFLDISVGIQWYFRDPKTGKKLDLYSDGAARFYEGKRQNLAVLRRVIHRYAAVDHRSGAYFIRYYYSEGENAEDVVDFLYRAMAEKTGVENVFPLRGIPTRIVADQGPAFKNALVAGLLEALGIKLELHKARNAKASGAVESRHNHWQRSFEGRLAARPAPDLTTLNTWTLGFCAVANAERPLTRHNRTAMDAWSTIQPHQLVEPPDRSTFFRLAATRPREGKLNNLLQVRAKGRRWEVTGVNVFPGQLVRYRLCPFLDAGIRVWDDSGRELGVTEIVLDDFGQPTNGRRHTWDSEAAKGATAPTTAGAQLADRVADGLELVELPEMFDDLPDRLAALPRLSPTGMAWEPPKVETAAEPLMGSLDARERVTELLGRGLTPAEAGWWREVIGDGITASDLEEALDEFSALPTARKEKQA